jgi:hypothetical protein
MAFRTESVILSEARISASCERMPVIGRLDQERGLASEVRLNMRLHGDRAEMAELLLVEVDLEPAGLDQMCESQKDAVRSLNCATLKFTTIRSRNHSNVVPE